MFNPIPAWEIGIICLVLGGIFCRFGYRAEKEHKSAYGFLYLGGFFFLAMGVVCGMSYLL